jgi:SH3 domain protein
VSKSKVKNKQIPFFSISVLSVPVLFAAVLASEAVYAETAYVSDVLKVPMRSGATTGHRILKFLISGTAVTVLETSEDGKYTHVEVGDKEGWVLTEDLMDVPSGRDRLVVVNKKLSGAREQVQQLKSNVAELKAEIKQLKNENNTLQNERTNLSNSLDDLKITAANPLALSRKNKELKKELEKAHANVAMLDKDNQQLRSNVMQDWFIIGGAVSIGSLLLGIILTRINWRRKRDSWGGSF